MNRQNGLDFVKGLACIAVVLIHYNFPGNLGIAVRAFCRFAVPFFLCVSGYFFLRKGKMEDAVVVRKIRHILSLLAMSGVFYWLATWVGIAKMDDARSIQQFVQEKLPAGKIVKFFLTNDPFAYSHLWFLLGLIYCYIFALLFFAGSKRLKAMYVLAPVLLIGYVVLQEFAGILNVRQSFPIPGSDDHIYLFNLFCFRALPFFLFGMIIKERHTQLAKLPLRNASLWLIAVSGGAIAIAERMMIGESQYFIGSYITVAALFIWALRSTVSSRNPLCFIGRELSLYVYIIHVAVGKFFDVFAGKLPFEGKVLVNYGKAPLVLAGSIAGAYVIYLIRQFVQAKRSAA